MEKPFQDREDLRFRRVFRGGWEVGHWCEVSNRWHWAKLGATSLRAACLEAPTVAARLMRESAVRWNGVYNDALKREAALNVEAGKLDGKIPS